MSAADFEDLEKAEEELNELRSEMAAEHREYYSDEY